MGQIPRSTERISSFPTKLLATFASRSVSGGNVLVCAAVKRERKLRSMFNYFLVSLALSDMLSAILVMPLSILRSLVGQYWSKSHRTSLLALIKRITKKRWLPGRLRGRIIRGVYMVDWPHQ